MIHCKCRSKLYPFGNNIQRFLFDDVKVAWTVQFDDYKPVEYNSETLTGKPWADPDLGDPKFKPNWNLLDNGVDRTSHTGIYIVRNGRPFNPGGRTGLRGRGVLGRWGPNHAADPIVTRWKMEDSKQQVDPKTNLPILQFCAIQRGDCNEWALPGGMVDPGEVVSKTVQREFMEEALSSKENVPDEEHGDNELLNEFFKDGTEIFSGYVDDPRNTDNAWMETVAINFHDDTGVVVGKLELKAGDDAKNVQWMDLDSSLDLYANHSDFLKKVARLRRCHW